MWDNVKPITLLSEQNNDDGSRFLMYFYSHDYEVVKLKEATYLDGMGRMVGSYSRLLDAHCSSKYDSNFFVEKLSNDTVKKLIEYYENPRLFIEYMF